TTAPAPPTSPSPTWPGSPRWPRNEGPRLRLAARAGGDGDDPDARLGAAAAGVARGQALRRPAVDRRAGGARVHLLGGVLARAGPGPRRVGRPARPARAQDAAAAGRSAAGRLAGELDVVSTAARAEVAAAAGHPALHRAGPVDRAADFRSALA